jgi:broad specificity phosphatase PhoE
MRAPDPARRPAGPPGPSALTWVPLLPEGHCFIVRHGRTALNAAGVLRVRLDPPLDEVGVAEAAATASAIGQGALAAPPRLVRTSPALRARQTAEALSAATGAAIEADDRRADRDDGERAGHAPSELVERFGSVGGAPGVEPLEHLGARVQAAFADGVTDGQRHVDGAVALVAHDIVNRLLLSLLFPAELPVPEGIPQRTAGWNLLVAHRDRLLLVVLDSSPWP